MVIKFVGSGNEELGLSTTCTLYVESGMDGICIIIRQSYTYQESGMSEGEGEEARYGMVWYSTLWHRIVWDCMELYVGLGEVWGRGERWNMRYEREGEWGSEERGGTGICILCYHVYTYVSYFLLYVHILLQ